MLLVLVVIEYMVDTYDKKPPGEEASVLGKVGGDCGWKGRHG